MNVSVKLKMFEFTMDTDFFVRVQFDCEAMGLSFRLEA